MYICKILHQIDYTAKHYCYTVSNIIFDGRDQGGNLFSSNNAPSRENAAVAGRHQHHLQWLRRDMGVTYPTIGQRGKTLYRYL